MADSIREALTKAVASSEEEAAKQVESTVVPTETTESTTPIVENKTGSDDGDSNTPESKATTSQDGKTSTAAPATPTSSQGAGAPSSSATASSNTTATQATADHSQAPSSWNAKEKAAWATMSPDARAAVYRRETEMRRAISASHEARGFKEGFDKEMHKYEPLLKEKGVTNIMGQVIQPMMQLRAGLEVGTPMQKAGIIGVLVRDFDIKIEDLDNVLTQMRDSGGLSPAARPQPVNYSQVPELQPLFALQRQLEEARAAKAEQVISEIASLPHFETLKDKIADVFDLAAAEGKTISALDAYDRAAAFFGLEPRVKPSITTSEAAAQLARSRKASSSVSGAPQSSVAKKATSRREQLEAAWADAATR